MAWIQVDKQTYNGTWGTDPPINLIWEATAYRDDVTNDLRITYTQSAKYVSGYFGYSIIGDAFVIDDSHAQGKTLKDNTPNTWETVSVTYEWNLGTITDSTVLCVLGYSTNGARDNVYLRLTLNTPMYVAPGSGEHPIGVQLKHNKEGVYPFCYFPIGAIFMSTSDVSPASIYGGEWTRIQDRFLIGAGGSYSVGATGGAATVALTTDTMPSHSHTATSGTGSTGSGTRRNATRGTGSAQTIYTEYTGSGTAHDNMPPYLVVYTWRRTA